MLFQIFTNLLHHSLSIFLKHQQSNIIIYSFLDCDSTNSFTAFWIFFMVFVLFYLLMFYFPLYFISLPLDFCNPEILFFCRRWAIEQIYQFLHKRLNIFFLNLQSYNILRQYNGITCTIDKNKVQLCVLIWNNSQDNVKWKKQAIKQNVSHFYLNIKIICVHIIYEYIYICIYVKKFSGIMYKKLLSTVIALSLGKE